MLTCQNCGEAVTADFARVFGDNENRIDGCLYCRTYEELTGENGDKAPLLTGR